MKFPAKATTTMTTVAIGWQADSQLGTACPPYLPTPSTPLAIRLQSRRRH